MIFSSKDFNVLAKKIYKEVKQEKQNIKFDFQTAAIQFSDVKDGENVSYTTEMFTGSDYGIPISQWSRIKWRAFVRASYKYHERHFKTLSVIDAIILTTSKDQATGDNLQFRYLV